MSLLRSRARSAARRALRSLGLVAITAAFAACTGITPPWDANAFPFVDAGLDGDAPVCNVGAFEPCACDGGTGLRICGPDHAWTGCQCAMRPVCDASVRNCACEGGTGVQQCENGVFGPCMCSRTCMPGTSRACVCDRDLPGEQACASNGEWGSCDCLPVCVPGASERCMCTDRVGARTCDASGFFGECVCDGSGCVPGSIEACTCAPGRDGTMLCEPWGGYSGCACSASDGGAAVVGDAGPDASPWTGRVRVRHLATGVGLVAAFGLPSAWLIVTHDEIRVVPRDGSAPQFVPVPRPISAAVYDGSEVVIADSAQFVVYSPTMVEQRRGDLRESCANALLVSGHRLVCNSDRIGTYDYFTVYSTTTGTALSRSARFLYGGFDAWRIPGTDDFISLLPASSSYAQRFSVGADHSVTFRSEDPGSPNGVAGHAFDGSPAVHVLSRFGRWLTVDAARCSSSPCFAHDGDLGTLTPGEMLYASVDNGAGNVIAAVLPSSGDCTRGCVVQRVDIAGRRVIATASVTTPYGYAAVQTYDPVDDALLVGTVSYPRFDLVEVSP